MKLLPFLLLALPIVDSLALPRSWRSKASRTRTIVVDEPPPPPPLAAATAPTPAHAAADLRRGIENGLTAHGSHVMLDYTNFFVDAHEVVYCWAAVYE